MWSDLFANMSNTNFFNFSFLPKYLPAFVKGFEYTLLLAVVSVALAVIPALLLALITSLSLAACSFVALPMDPEQPTNQKQEQLAEDGTYTTKEDVARYIHLYGHLPDNFITKKEAQQLGWTGGSLEPYAPGCCIGGSRFGNYEGLLPEADGRTWTECDINTQGARSRGPERIVFSNDGLIYYTGDHYQTFELLYGGE